MAALSLELSHGPYIFLAKPSPNEVLLFKEHVKATGYPETYSKIDPSPTRDLSDAEILAEFTVDRRKRTDLDEAPCPICSPFAPKFLAGYLVWFPHERTMRAIGKECGRSVNEKWANEQWAHKKRKEKAAREEYLFAKLHLVPALKTRLEDQATRANLQYQTWLELRKQSPAIVQHLRSGMKSGRLTVAEKRNLKSGVGLKSTGNTTQFTEVEIGFVKGQSAVRTTFQLHNKIQEHIGSLGAVDMGEDVESAGLSLCEMSDREMKVVEKVIKAAEKCEEKSKAQLEDFDAFFEKDTIALLNKWASHPISGFNFVLEVTPSKRSMKLRSEEFGFEQVVLHQFC